MNLERIHEAQPKLVRPSTKKYYSLLKALIKEKETPKSIILQRGLELPGYLNCDMLRLQLLDFIRI